MADPVSIGGSLSTSTVLTPYMPVFYVAFLVTLCLTPLMRYLAHRNGIVDEPDGKRKVHTQPIAYLGGVATFLGWLAGVSASLVVHPHNADPSMVNVQVPPGILLGATTVVLFGLMDDVYGLTPKVKIAGQFVAAAFLFLFGIGRWGGLGRWDDMARMFIQPLVNLQLIPDINANHWVHLALIAGSGLFVIFLIVAACNATNLLDGLDGLCSGVTSVMSIGYLILAVHLATVNLDSMGVSEVDPTRITLALALLGAVLGFLPFNFNPASIFMGDTGSMFLGYICGTMIILFGHDGIIRWFLAAVVIFGLPMLDTLLAIVRRKLNGKPIFSPDSNHIHHFLIRRGMTVRKAVFTAYALAAVFVSFALVVVIVPTRLALGIYMVLFGWLVVAAFKMGMIFQRTVPLPQNNTAVLSDVTGTPPTDLSNKNLALPVMTPDVV